MPDTTPRDTGALLEARERQALLWTCRVRIGLAGFGMAVATVFTGSLAERAAMYALMITFGATHLFIHQRLHRGGSLEALGLAGAIVDALALAAMPAVWHLVYTTEAEPLAHLLAHNFTAICATFIALGTLALRPLYPLLLTAWSVTLQLGLAVLAITDPRLEHFEGGLDRALGVGKGVSDFFLEPILLGMAGVLLGLATRAARETLREVVELEHDQHRLRQEQLEALLDAKMSAVGDLVAGVEHEVNSPLGAVRSAADTATRSLAMLRAAAALDDPVERARKTERAMQALEASAALVTEGSRRISHVMSTIQDFVELDRGELQKVDLALALREVVELLGPSMREDTRVELALGEGFVIEGDGRRLREAFRTVVRNAAESFDGPGTLRIALGAENGAITVTVSDQGRGISKPRLATLFEADFASEGRVRARFGLALCRTVLRRHGGDIEVDSTPGRGTCVTMRLPLAARNATSDARAGRTESPTPS